MKRNAFLIAVLFLLSSLPCLSQKLVVDTFYMAVGATTDITASTHPRKDAADRPCALVKVRLPRGGASFEGSVIPPTQVVQSEYLVYMTAGSKTLTVKLAGAIAVDVDFQRWHIDRLEALRTYILEIQVPENVGQNVDDGMQYVTMQVTPPNAVVQIDYQLMALSVEGTLSVRLPRGEHVYKIEAPGYEPKEGSFTLGDARKDLVERLASSMATLAIRCGSADAELYVNDVLKGRGQWSGTLVPGNYLVEARMNGRITQRQSVNLTSNQTFNVEFPALVAATGQLDVNYSPINAEVWVDGVRKGTSPNRFSGLAEGSHRVEIRKDGYASKMENVVIKAGDIVSLGGSLTAAASSAQSVASSAPVVTASDNTQSIASASSTQLQSYKTCPDDHHPHMIDLGLPSGTKWACCNVGASKPEEYGGYYAWGETEVQANNKYDWSSYRHCDGSKNNCHDIGKDISGTQYDVAHVKMGGAWRMPTLDQIKELKDNCSHTWTTRNGKQGIEVVGRNGGKLFLPAAGLRWGWGLYGEGSYGYFWSSSLSLSDEHDAYYLSFYTYYWEWCGSRRGDGQSVRAVCP